jgi:LETM1-like protein
MGIPPYGGDSFLRFQLRHRMRMLQEDDQRILWEGIDSLTKMELREACQERGMRSTGLSKDAYKRALQQWLDLSVKRNVPTSLLIMSRTFFLREETLEQGTDDGTKSIAGLADAISGLDKEVVNEVILNVATSEEKMSDPGVRKIKLEVLMKQNELIEQEQAEREVAAAKKKEQAGKEKIVVEKEKLSSLDEPGVPDITIRSADANDATSDGRIEAPSTTSTASDLSNVPASAKDSRVKDDLSPAEMDAISQLVSADPVSKERADLESIKAALQDEKNTKRESDAVSAKGGEQRSIADNSTLSGDPKNIAASGEIDVTDNAADTTKGQTPGLDDVAISRPESPTVSDDPVVAKLKKSIESMVDKIEVQLSDAHFKIGNKLHVLDKDMDGLLSVEEIAEALQLVLKRKITHEEAIEIARKMVRMASGGRRQPLGRFSALTVECCCPFI